MTLDDFRTEWLNGSPVVRAHTSGSTGTPKPVELLKADMLVSARATVDFFGLGCSSDFVCPLSVDYIAGKMMAVRAWLCGTEPTMLAPSNNPQLPPHSDLLAVVVSQVPAIIEAVKSGKCRVRNMLVGGSALHTSLASRITDEMPNVAAYESYGMTETCSHVALRRVGGDGIFRAMKGITFDTDSRRCLRLRLDNYSVKSLQTNDIVDLLSPTSFRWLGRFDNVINTGALKVYPEQVECEITVLIPDCPSFYISSEPDPKWGDRVVLVTETCAPDSPFADISILHNRLAGRLPAHHIPKNIIYVDALPRTANGKIRRIRPPRP